MGYTNYWEREPNLPSSRFAAAVVDCKRLLKELAIPLGGRDGAGSPVFMPELIQFNGRRADSYETFAVSRTVSPRLENQRVFEFCKTGQRRYDLAVQCCLIVLKHHLAATITVRSDGNDADWDAARQACHRVLGFGDKFKLET